MSDLWACTLASNAFITRIGAADRSIMTAYNASLQSKGQQNSNKMVKKPKKDTSPPKPVSADAVRPSITTVVPVRGKLKNAQR